MSSPLSTVTEKGQTTIPAEVRKALSLKPHQRLTYEICEGGVVVRPETENHPFNNQRRIA